MVYKLIFEVHINRIRPISNITIDPYKVVSF